MELVVELEGVINDKGSHIDGGNGNGKGYSWLF